MNLEEESYSLIITGVGGQGNVLFSQLIGKVFIDKGYFVTIGETYGASQRGGSVMSHIRISRKKQRGPLIPKGKADIIIALEPVEALRVIAVYGNPDVVVLVNTRPIYPIDVIAGDDRYPEVEEIKKLLDDLSADVYYIDATEIAVQMGPPILANMIMIGALLELKLIPLKAHEFNTILSREFTGERLNANLKAIDEGRRIVQQRLGER